MDSTMIYQLVLEQLHQKQELVNLLPSFHALLNPPLPHISTHKMNDQQILAQVHQSVSSSLQEKISEKN